jgi:hypothetical protein
VSGKFFIRSRSRGARLSATAFATLVATWVLLAAAPLQAANYSWAVSAGDWCVVSNWVSAILPTSSDTAYVVNGGTVNVTQPGSTCNSLYVGYFWGTSR